MEMVDMNSSVASSTFIRISPHVGLSKTALERWHDSGQAQEHRCIMLAAGTDALVTNRLIRRHHDLEMFCGDKTAQSYENSAGRLCRGLPALVADRDEHRLQKYAAICEILLEEADQRRSAPVAGADHPGKLPQTLSPVIASQYNKVRAEVEQRKANYRWIFPDVRTFVRGARATAKQCSSDAAPIYRDHAVRFEAYLGVEGRSVRNMLTAGETRDLYKVRAVILDALAALVKIPPSSSRSVARFYLRWIKKIVLETVPPQLPLSAYD